MDLQKVTLPLLILDVEHNDQKQALAHVLNQHDAGYVQPFILNSGDDTYDVPAEDFHFRASRPDGQIIDVDNSNGSLVQKGDQNWLLNLPTGVTEAPGLVKCVVYAKDGGHVLASSQQIMYNVMPAFDVEDASHVSYVPDLDKLKAKLTDLVGKAQDQVSRLSGITAGDKQAAEQALKEELDKLDKQAGDWLDGEKANINKQIADIVKQSSGLDEAYKQAYKEEIDKLAGQTGKDYEAKLQAVIDKLNSEKQASLQAINDDWTKQKGSLQTDITGFKADLTKQVEAIISTVNALNTGDLPAIQTKVNSFKDALDKLNSQISAIKLDYYTKDEIDNKLDNLKAGATPDLTALKKQVQDNTTSLQSKVGKDELANYALKSDVPTTPDLTGYAKTADVNKELDSKADKTALANYALKSELPAMPDLSAYAKVTALEDYATKQALDSYALKTDLPDLTGYAKKTDLPAPVDLTPYAKKTDLPDVSGLETQTDHENDVKKINETLETYAKKSDLPSTDGLETKADHKADIDKLNKALEAKADVSAIPALPDMNKYALKTDLKNVDLTGYLTKDDADRLLGEKANESELAEYAKKTDLPPIPNLTIYAKVTDVAKALNNKADKDELRDYAKTADVEKANTAATNALNAAKTAFGKSQNAVQGIFVDGGHPADKDESGWVNLQLGLSDYLKKADANNEYAKKTDLPDTRQFATKEDLASASDYYANVPDGAVAHANVYRNKVINLSDADTKAQIKQAIKDETFRNIFPGDIWEINNRRYYVADINAENYGPTSKDVDNKQYPNVRTYRPTVSLLTMIPKPDGAGDYWVPVMDSSNDLSNKGVAGADIQANINSLTASVKQDFDNNLLYFNNELSDKINSNGTFHIAKSNISMELEWNYCQLSALPSEIMATGNSRFALKPDHIDFNVYFVTGKQMAIAKLNANFTRMMLDNETKHGQVPSGWIDYPGGITLQDLSSKNTNLTMNEYGNIGESSITNGDHGSFVYYIIYDL